MSRLHEPLTLGKHDKLTSEINETIIAIKLHDPEIARESVEQQNKIIEARKNHPKPDWAQMVDLLTRIRDEMHSCREPLKRY